MAFGVKAGTNGFQSARPRGRTRLSPTSGFCAPSGFNPRVLAGGRDGIRRKRKVTRCVSIRASSREDATLKEIGLKPDRKFQSARPRGRTRHRYKCRPGHSDCFNPRALAISRSHNLAIMDCSLQAVGERKVKTMAKICPVETAIRGSLRVHDKRKPLNARRMPMHSFVSTPL